MNTRTRRRGLLAMVAAAAVALPSAPTFAGSVDIDELEQRCEQNAPTPDERSRCLDVVHRYLAVDSAPSSSPASGAGPQVSVPVETDVQEVTLVEVAWDWSDPHATLVTEAGDMFVAVLVKLTGIDPAGSSYNPFYFSLFDEDGFEFDSLASGRDPALGASNDLAAGQTVQGWLTFEIPRSTTSVRLTYTNPLSVSVVTWALPKSCRP